MDSSIDFLEKYLQDEPMLPIPFPRAVPVCQKCNLRDKEKKPTETTFFKNMTRLLESGEHSDFTIIIGKTEMPVHKCILSIHSQVFSTMFSQSDTSEVLENRVNITDVSLEVFTDLLQFMYTGVKPTENHLTKDLLIAADKYMVEELKSYCQENLMSQISLDNVIHLFQVGDMVNASGLKASCLDFITANFKKLVSTAEFEKLGRINYELMVEVFRALPK